MNHTIKHQFKNTIISFQCISKYRRKYQCLLKSQTDHLSDKGKRWRESREVLNFFIWMKFQAIVSCSLVTSGHEIQKENLLKQTIAGTRQAKIILSLCCWQQSIILTKLAVISKLGLRNISKRVASLIFSNIYTTP